ncbi:phage terminase large subunit family protein [bacterium]|nr:phage terminase large subunit family protein [bacterium]
MKKLSWSEREKEAWRPPEKLTVSEWADKNRVLDVKTSAEPGQWRTRRTPYLKEIMDAFTDPNVEDITIMASSQVGKTECMYNMLGYVIDQDPGPALMVLPRIEDARSISYDRVQPMIRLSSALSSHVSPISDDITKLEYQLDRMIMYFAGANSPAGLASRPVRYVFLDEIDKYPKFSGKEADPIKLATERQKTFWNKKTVKVSTPTTEDSYIFREYKKSDQSKYYVPCPHCGKYQVLYFSQIKWPDEETSGREIQEKRLAWYECHYCQKKINDNHKLQIMIKGVWCPEGAEIDNAGNVKDASHNKHRGFWINSLYSPWLTWSDIAKEFLDSKDYVELLMNFVNSWLAEIWEDKVEETTIDVIKELACDYDEGIVPDDVLVLTAGVDVQKGHFYYSIRGWGYCEESWLIRRARVESWFDIEEDLFNTRYKKIGSDEVLPVYMTCIDTGYNADEVYRFCRKWKDKAKAIKGQVSITSGRFYKSSKIDINSKTGAIIKNGLILWHIDVNHYKNKISRLVHSEDPKKWHIFRDPHREYLTQFTAEHKVLERRKGKPVREIWKLKKGSGANHYFDTEVYSVAAADISKILNIREENRVRVHKPVQRGTSRENWIRKREGAWI